MKNHIASSKKLIHDEVMILNALTIFVAVEHLFFLVLEMFFWKSAYARKAFRMSLEKAEASEALAKNQGLYNGFLAAGLLWSFCLQDAEQMHVRAFFLICVGIAGIYGALTANKRIFFIQSVPAILALILMGMEKLS